MSYRRALLMQQKIPFFDYLQTDGTAYIETGYIPTQTSTYTTSIYTPSWPTYSGSQYFWVFGVGSQQPSCVFGWDTSSSRRISVYNISTYYYSREMSCGNYLCYRSAPSLNSSGYDSGDSRFAVPDLSTSLKEFTTTGGTGSYLGGTIKLFLKSVGNTKNGISTGLPSGSKMYGFRIYEGSNLVHDYKPATQGDTPGMYDTVTCKFFGNAANSGTFTVGND